MYTLGINLSHHSSIALLKNNEVVLFTLEERMNRKKYCRTIPFECLKLIPKITKQIDCLIATTCSKVGLSDIIKYLKSINVEVISANINNTDHHKFHAAAGFYMSHFDHASCLIIDGAGSMTKFRSTDGIRASETTSIYDVKFPNTFTCLYKNFTVGIYDSGLRFNSRMNVNLSITEEDVELFKKKFNNIKQIDVSTNTDIGFRYTIVSHLIGFPKMGGEGKTMGLSAYGPVESNIKSKLAYEIQKELEQTFLNRVSMCEDHNLVLGGGCSLNILGNSLIKKTFPNKNIYIDPVAADCTNALGAAALQFYKSSGCMDKLVFNPYGGPLYNLNKNYINELTRKYSI